MILLMFLPYHALVDFESWPTSMAALADMMTSARESGGDVLMLRKLPQPPTLRLPKETLQWASTVSPYIDLKSTQDLSGKLKANIRRRNRNLETDVGQITLTRATESTKKEWFKAWVDLQVQSWKSHKDEAAVLAQPQVRDQMSRWILDLPLPDWMRLYRYTAGSKTLGLALCLVWEDVFYFQLPALNPDPDLRKYGIGKSLVQALVHQARAENLSYFDFLQGDEAYKWDWNPIARPLYQCEIPLTWKGRLAVLIRRAQLKLGLLRRPSIPTEIIQEGDKQEQAHAL